MPSAMSFTKATRVSTVLVEGYHMPYYTEFTEPELSYIWSKPNQKAQPKPLFTTPFEPVRASQSMNGVQGSLF
jgi:hypothetical protein